jgi:hypothetical protein
MGKQCEVLSRSRSVESLSQEFADRVLDYVTLDESWKQRMIAALTNNGGVTEAKANQVQGERLRKALENLCKQHLWEISRILIIDGIEPRWNDSLRRLLRTLP